MDNHSISHGISHGFSPWFHHPPLIHFLLGARLSVSQATRESRETREAREDGAARGPGPIRRETATEW